MKSAQMSHQKPARFMMLVVRLYISQHILSLSKNKLTGKIALASLTVTTTVLDVGVDEIEGDRSLKLVPGRLGVFDLYAKKLVGVALRGNAVGRLVECAEVTGCLLDGLIVE